MRGLLLTRKQIAQIVTRGLLRQHRAIAQAITRKQLRQHKAVVQVITRELQQLHKVVVLAIIIALFQELRTHQVETNQQAEAHHAVQMILLQGLLHQDHHLTAEAVGNNL